jgi:hypothetical protein
MKYWEIIADNLSKAGWSWGCVSVVDSLGRTIWIVDAHGYGRRFIVRADVYETTSCEQNVIVCVWALSRTISETGFMFS